MTHARTAIEQCREKSGRAGENAVQADDLNAQSAR